MKIKKLAIFAMVVGCCAISSFAQINSLPQLPKALYGTPDKYQGYFVFDAVNNPDVAFWVVDIYQVTEENDSTRSSKQVDRISIKEQSFLKFDDKYFKSKDIFEIKVIGYNNNSIVIAEDFWEFVPHGVAFWEETCGANCNGKTYAYRVSLNAEYTNSVITGNTHRVELTGAAEHTHAEVGYYLPYYRNMSFTEKQNMCQNGGISNSNSHLYWNSPQHYGYVSCPSFPDDINYFKVTATNSDNLKDKDGNTLTGEVWRIIKTRGYWRNQSSSTNYNSSLIPMFAEDKCGELMAQGSALRILGFTNYANDLLTLDNTLFCDGFYSSGGFGGTGSSTGGLEYKKIFGKYIFWNWGVSGDGSGGGSGGSGNIFDDLVAAASELATDITNNTGVPWWPSDSIFSMQIYRLDVNANNIPEGPIVEFRRDELFESNGTPVSTNLTLERGLYNMLFSFSDGLSMPIIFDVKEKVVNNYMLSNYLDVVIFPVPIMEQNTFNISLDAEATLKFNYYIHDDNGNELFNRNFVMHKGHERVVKIPTTNLPSGILFHKFVFEDNSEINKTTIKN